MQHYVKYLFVGGGGGWKSNLPLPRTCHPRHIPMLPLRKSASSYIVCVSTTFVLVSQLFYSRYSGRTSVPTLISVTRVLSSQKKTLVVF